METSTLNSIFSGTTHRTFTKFSRKLLIIIIFLFVTREINTFVFLPNSVD